MDPVDTVVAFETPERVVFRHRLAGPAPRAVAWLVDALIQVLLGLMVMAVALLAGISLGELGTGVAGAIALLGVFMLQWGYTTVFEAWWRGQTPGKVALGLRVVRRDGGPVGWREALLRNLLRAADALPSLYVVGLVTMAVDPRLRRLGDLVAGTMVVAEGRGHLEDTPAIDPPVTPAERDVLPARVRLLPEERAVIAGLLRRAHALGPLRVEELAARLAPQVEARTGVTGQTAWRTLQLAWVRAVRGADA